MNDLISQIRLAQKDAAALERLLVTYLPFIKKQIASLSTLPLEYDDMLSLAMVTFAGCVKQYDESKGSFFGFCSVCIKNRLLDESRKQAGYRHNVVPLCPDAGENGAPPPELEASIARYELEQERLFLHEEIRQYDDALKSFGIRLQELPRICPKQKRSRSQCLLLATAIAGDKNHAETLRIHKRIAQKDLAEQFHISVKTIEKHRRYIVALAVLILGDYPGIRAFLPGVRDEGIREVTT